MKIGIITFYRVPNFGANLQALSTYRYLENAGHTPVFLHYISKWTSRVYDKLQNDVQVKKHFEFIDQFIPNQSKELRNSRDVLKAIEEYKLDAVIIGSDAVAQHHPLLSNQTIHSSWKSWLKPIQPELRFPNLFWGCGVVGQVPMAFMSVSSQNSPFMKFSKKTKREMLNILDKLEYVSSRDVWTKQMYEAIGYKKDVPITPDPVFAFNQNADGLIPSKDEILKRFGLPEKYALVGLKSQVLSFDDLSYIQGEFQKEAIECVAFPIIPSINYKHPFKYVVGMPLSPIDWYAIIRYSSAYIGNNMHPIVVSLHNAIPCFSLDNWGAVNFWGKKLHDNSSKVLDILSRYGLADYRCEVENGKCTVSVEYIMEKIKSYPRMKVLKQSHNQLECYNSMMEKILSRFKCCIVQK